MNRVWGGDETNIEPGLARCRELVHKNKAIIVNTVDHARTLLSQEEAWLVGLQPRGTNQAKADGTPVEFVYPEEGAINVVVNLGIIKGRPAESEKLAQEFLNFTLDPARQAEFSQRTDYPPTNVKAIAMLPKGSDLILSPERLANLGKIRLDMALVVANRSAHAERWNKEVLGG
jgi:putative spermidine/putrescine transport system substrate-binding protein